MAKSTATVSSGRARIKFTTARVIKRDRAATAKAFAEVSRKMQARIRKAISRQGPPRSKPGRYPKKDTGRMHATTSVTAKGRTITINTTDYGLYLDQGFTHARSGKKVHRPWYTKLLLAKDARRNWERQLNTAMRKHSKRG